MRRSGVTLIELMAVAVLGLIVVLTIGQVDVARVHLTQPLQGKKIEEGLMSEAGFSWGEMVRQLQRADRVVLLDPLNDPACASPTASGQCYQTVQFRVPQGVDFDASGNYKWSQFTFVPANEEIRGYDDMASNTPTAIFKHISWLSFQFSHVAKDPPGLPNDAKPFDGNEDNNVLMVTVRSSGDEISFSGAVVPWAYGYTNLKAVCRSQCCDSGLGLAPEDVSPPHIQCS